MAPSTLWSGGRYDAVGDRIAPIAQEVVAAAHRRRPIPDATVVDLACGTGSAALAARARGAQVTGVDVTPELLAIAAARPGAEAVTWRTADAADTGLPAASFDVAVSNMGIIFVDPQRQLPELARILKPDAALAFSAWTRDTSNPFFDPVVTVLGRPATSGFSPEQWGDAGILRERLAPLFADVDVQYGRHRWEFESVAAALHFLREESPVHVETFRRIDPAQRDELAAEFESAMNRHRQQSGAVAFTAPYVVATAIRRS